MAETVVAKRQARRAREHADTRRAILDAARGLAARDGARNLSLRGVAAEAGYAPAALYGYFRSRNELILALAADDLSSLAREVRQAARASPAGAGFGSAAKAALGFLCAAETLAAAAPALGASADAGDAERLFTGRLIGALNALSEAAGGLSANRGGQCDVVLIAAALSGLAMLSRSGRLNALGFSADELVARMEDRFRKRP
jgi:AcrR family transcriptional regulator